MVMAMYAIPNCDTVRKARRWLKEYEIAYTFHDYKKEGVDAALLQDWCAQVGWEVLLNKRGTTWRKLEDADKQDMNQEKALRLLQEHSSMIKRPVLLVGERLLVGFSEDAYAEACLP